MNVYDCGVSVCEVDPVPSKAFEGFPDQVIWEDSADEEWAKERKAAGCPEQKTVFAVLFPRADCNLMIQNFEEVEWHDKFRWFENGFVQVQIFCTF